MISIFIESMKKGLKKTNTSSKIITTLKSKVSSKIKDNFKFKSTKDLKVSKKLIEQVIGQEDAVNIIKKAAAQRRHVLLIGEPGTGKSMLGVALAELLPKEKLVDVLSFPNPNDVNTPLIRTVPAGKGRDLTTKSKLSSLGGLKNSSGLMIIFALLIGIIPYWLWRSGEIPDVIYAALIISGIVIIFGIVMAMNLSRKMQAPSDGSPKIIVDNFNKKQAPFLDASGAHAGALLGDVLHDPFQSGGLGTPAHERVVAGMIHKAHMGVLFIDEIATLHPATQQELLTAVQDGKLSITGQSERSAGAMVRTEPAPCKFIMVAAGNIETVQHMHPALRSRIRGYGYEIYMKETIPDSPATRFRVAQFVAQEVNKDGKIPHFSREAVRYIVEEARKKANRKDHLTLRFRDLGGLVRAAGDVAKEEGATLVEKAHIIKAKIVARTLEHQMADHILERRKEYEVIVVKGRRVGRVNGLAVMGGSGSYSGIILPIESEITPGGKKTDITATGKLGEIAKEAIQNVSAIVKKYFGDDLKEKHDIYVQFLQTYEGVEGDSASIAVATTIISALKDIPIKQSVAMTGSLSVRGEVLPIGGVSAKIEAAIDAGIEKVIVPRSNMQDIVVDEERLVKIKVIPVDTLLDVLENALYWKGKEKILKKLEKSYKK